MIDLLFTSYFSGVSIFFLVLFPPTHSRPISSCRVGHVFVTPRPSVYIAVSVLKKSPPISSLKCSWLSFSNMQYPLQENRILRVSLFGPFWA